MTRPLAVGGGAALAASLISGTAAEAATFNVTNTSDGPGSGPAGSLRRALYDSSNTPGTNDTIVFASGLSGTIRLTSAGRLYASDPHGLTISGPGARQLTINANGTDGAFAIDGPTTLSGLTLTGGSGNPEIYSSSSPVTLEQMTITGNAAGGSSGGAVNVYNAALTIDGSTISANSAKAGGGIFQGKNASLTVRDSTIEGNTATNGNGGGIDLAASAGNAATASIIGSTIAGNHAPSGNGGGLAATDSNASLQDSIVSGNTASSNPDVFNTFTSPTGSYLSAQFSLIQNESGTPINNPVGDIIGQDPLLGGLQNNGGPTDTMKPAPNSPVIDQGKAFGLTTDQRGLSRPVDIGGIPNSSAAGADGSDMGALELQFADFPPTLASLSPTSGGPGTSVVIAGQFLSGATQVLFGSTPASAFTIDSDKQIRATVPAGSGTVDVRVITPGGETAVVSGDQFTYPPPPAPPAAPVPAVTCSLNAASVRARVRAAVTARKRSGTGSGRAKGPAPTTLSMSVHCNQDANVSVTGTIMATVRRKVQHKRRKRKVHLLFTLPVVTASVQAGATKTLTLTLPTGARTAFGQKGKRSASLTIKASNANGTTTKQTAIAKL